MKQRQKDAIAIFIFAMLTCCVLAAIEFKDFLGFLMFEAYQRMR